MSSVLVLAEHIDGTLSDSTYEMIGLAKPLGDVHVGLIGGDDAMLKALGAATKVYRVDTDGLGDFNPSSYAAAARAIAEASGAEKIFVAYSSMGMDVCSYLGVHLKKPVLVGCVETEADKAVLQLYGGKMNVRVESGSSYVAMIAAGTGSMSEGQVEGAPEVQSVTAPAGVGQVVFKKWIKPDSSDVDITTQDILVAVGRGIGSKDGIEAVQELADALKSPIAASRPIIDAGWLPKSRQVGKSGLKVKPKLYLALGISGAPEHLEGMRDSSTIIAVNTDKNAPIFGVAHYGLTADLFDICEELTEALEDR